MEDQANKPVESAAETNQPSTPPRRWRARTAIVVIVALIAVVAIGAIWMLWPRQTGKPVAAPRTVSFAESPQPPMSGEQRLTLTPEQSRNMQLKIETVGEAPSAEAASQMATGVVQVNTYKETPVMSVVGGILRSVSAELGQNVQKGQRVAVVFSNELADAQSRYLAALAVLDEHHRHHMRTEKLVDIGAASRQELEMATSQLRDAESNLADLRQKLMLLGMPTSRIDNLKSTSQISSEVTIASPSTGTITARSVNSGEVIEANKELLRVTDLSTVWVVGQVYEKNLATVRVGSGANVTSDAYPERVFRGRVTYVDPRIDPATRTAQVRIEMANPKQLFKIGMFVNIAFGALGVGERIIPMVPKDAVQAINSQQVVFIATDKPTEFIMRAVQLSAETNGFYPATAGVSAGDRVVTQGSFLLRAEWLKEHPAQ